MESVLKGNLEKILESLSIGINVNREINVRRK
jgi:hypothetical protein